MLLNMIVAFVEKKLHLTENGKFDAVIIDAGA